MTVMCGNEGTCHLVRCRGIVIVLIVFGQQWSSTVQWNERDTQTILLAASLFIHCRVFCILMTFVHSKKYKY